LGLSGCGKPAESNGTIAVICQAQGVQFWDQVKVGAEEAGDELNYVIKYSSSQAASDVEGQKALIQQAINDKVDGIVVAPNSPTDLNDVLQAADTAGIPVITISTTANYSGVKSYIGSSNSDAGSIAGRQALTELGPTGGNIGIVGHSATAANSTQRIQGFTDLVKSRIEATEETDDNGNSVIKVNYTIVDTVFSSNGQRDDVKQVTLDLIKAHPEIDLLYATNENSTLGVCDAVDEAGKTGAIKVIGFNSNDAEITYLKSGTLTGTMVQSPYNMGYLGVRYIDALKNGETIRKSYDTGAMYVARSNMDEDFVQLWLDPSSKE
jgi:ribose transport system substrate-binding protein